MSKIDFKPPVGGTGVFSFVPPATNTDRTISLPDAGGQMHTSQSVNDHATMPTVNGDPIVESGSNSDGDWIRWADGSQHCYRVIEVDPTVIAETTYPVPMPFVGEVHGGAQFRFGTSATYQAWLQNTENYIIALASALNWTVKIEATTPAVGSPRGWAFGRWK